MFQPTALQMETLAAVCRATAAYQGTDIVVIGALREMTRLTRAEFNTLIIATAMAGLISLLTEDNQKTITPTMRYNAVTFAGVDMFYAIAN